jgi:hypothetical protein
VLDFCSSLRHGKSSTFGCVPVSSAAAMRSLCMLSTAPAPHSHIYTFSTRMHARTAALLPLVVGPLLRMVRAEMFSLISAHWPKVNCKCGLGSFGSQFNQFVHLVRTSTNSYNWFAVLPFAHTVPRCTMKPPAEVAVHTMGVRPTRKLPPTYLSPSLPFFAITYVSCLLLVAGGRA